MKPIDVQIAPMLGRCHEVGGKLTPGGNQLLRNMLDECKLLNIPIHTRTKAVELLRDESLNCTGVKLSVRTALSPTKPKAVLLSAQAASTTTKT